MEQATSKQIKNYKRPNETESLPQVKKNKIRRKTAALSSYSGIPCTQMKTRCPALLARKIETRDTIHYFSATILQRKLTFLPPPPSPPKFLFIVLRKKNDHSIHISTVFKLVLQFFFFLIISCLLNVSLEQTIFKYRT